LGRLDRLWTAIPEQVRDILLHTLAAIALLEILTGLVALSVDLAIIVAVVFGLYLREVTQIQKARGWSFLRGWFLAGELNKHVEWAVPAAVTVAWVLLT